MEINIPDPDELFEAIFLRDCPNWFGESWMIHHCKCGTCVKGESLNIDGEKLYELFKKRLIKECPTLQP